MSKRRPDPTINAERGAELHERLRAFLLATMAHESPATIVSALMYEVVSITASIAASPGVADELLREYVENGRRQVRAFGVGRPHP